MRGLEGRLTKLETSAYFAPDVQSMSDEELAGLLMASVDDWPRVTAIIGDMSWEQLNRFHDALMPAGGKQDELPEVPA